MAEMVAANPKQIERPKRLTPLAHYVEEYEDGTMISLCGILFRRRFRAAPAKHKKCGQCLTLAGMGYTSRFQLNWR